MNILYVVTVGSTMGFFKSLIKKLLDEGNCVDIACGVEDSNVVDDYRAWGCAVHHISCSRSPLKKGNIDAIKELRRIVQDGDYDIVHCHTPIAAACTRLACRPLRKSGLKVIYTAHGFHFYKGAPLMNWMVFFTLEWFCSFLTDVIVTINGEDYQRAKKHMHPKKTVYVPGVGINCSRFSDCLVNRQKKREELGIPEDAFLLLSVGELDKFKNHENIIRAIDKLKDKNLYYAFAGEGNVREFLQKLIENFNLSDRVKMLGYRKDVAELYKCSDLFVFPSYREGLPVALMEAMAAGLPCAVSDIRGNNDLIQNNALYISPSDYLITADVIADVKNNPALLLTEGQRNAELSKRFDYSIINKQMIDIYLEVVGQ